MLSELGPAAAAMEIQRKEKHLSLVCKQPYSHGCLDIVHVTEKLYVPSKPADQFGTHDNMLNTHDITLKTRSQPGVIIWISIASTVGLVFCMQLIPCDFLL